MAAQKPAGSRLPEKWFRRGLWLIALVFASFLIGLGGKIIGDLPLAVETRTLEDYADRPGAQPLRAEKERLQTEAAKLADARDQAALELDKQQAQTAAAAPVPPEPAASAVAVCSAPRAGSGGAGDRVAWRGRSPPGRGGWRASAGSAGGRGTAARGRPAGRRRRVRSAPPTGRARPRALCWWAMR